MATEKPSPQEGCIHQIPNFGTNQVPVITDNPETVPDNPPAYSHDQSRTSQRPPSAVRLAVPNVPFKKYHLPLSAISDDEVTTTTTEPLFSSSTPALTELIRQQAALPPRPLVRIQGSYFAYGNHGSINVAFDVKLSLMALLIRPQNDLWNYLSVKPEDDAVLSGGDGQNFSREEGQNSAYWMRRFCEDPAAVKSFVLERRVTNWDTNYIEGQIRNLLSSMQFKGDLEITFPVLHTRVVVQKGTEPWEWVSKLMKQYRPRRYEVVQSVWPYATAPLGSSPRECAVQSEETWWQEWKMAIRNAILSGRRGWVSTEDRIDVALGLHLPDTNRWPWGSGREW